MLDADRLELARAGRTILSGVSFALPKGSLTALIGPNGAGKSTLLSALAGDLAPVRGAVSHDARPIGALSLVERARIRAMLPQRPQVAFGFPVRAVVAMGLHPHGLDAAAGAGARIVGHALGALDLGALADRPAFALSGGEEQRMHLARTLAQVEGALEAGRRPLLLLDEPTTGLDYRHQEQLAELLGALSRRGVTIVMSVHDIALAREVATHVLLLAEGALRADGPPHAVLRAPLLSRWFGLSERAAGRLAA